MHIQERFLLKREDEEGVLREPRDMWEAPSTEERGYGKLPDP